MEREARYYSYAVALYGYLLCVSALANCNNILAGGAILPHLNDAVCIELRFNLFRFPFFEGHRSCRDTLERALKINQDKYGLKAL